VPPARRDIKPENILLLDDCLKLADFGSCRGIYSKQPYTEYISTRWCACTVSRPWTFAVWVPTVCVCVEAVPCSHLQRLTRARSHLCPPPPPPRRARACRYRAPECLLTDGYYNYKMDMWGVGCVMFEVVALYPLFPGVRACVCAAAVSAACL
jgi:renal tumor antigen